MTDRDAGQPSVSVGDVARARRPRIAYLSYSSGEFDARTFRMARSAIAAGYEVIVYARMDPGSDLPAVEEQDGFRVVRAPTDWRLAVPGLSGAARRRAAEALARVGDARSPTRDTARTTATDAAKTTGSGATTTGTGATARGMGIVASEPRPVVSIPVRLRRFPRRVARRLLRPVLRTVQRWMRVLVMFPFRPLGWSRGLDPVVVEGADIWHGMWAGSLPALQRLRGRYGGRTIYDSRDVYMESRDFARLERPLRAVLARLERRWAHRADRVLTVNAAFASLLATQLEVPSPAIVMNCPEAWTPPHPAPDLIRVALELPSTTAIVLYQGQLISDRGIEQAMEAILEVPAATLVLLGYGTGLARYRNLASDARYRERVRFLPAVPPSALLLWTASADVVVMPIQPTSANHRHTTPQKLFEALAAGVPVVASDLPGMAAIVRDTGAGELCDPTSPASIAEAIRRIVSASPQDRAALRARALDAAHREYSWELQVETLLEVYAGLIGAR